jgi:hypothetical protein
MDRNDPKHGYILLATQSRWSLAELISALERDLTETNKEDWRGRVRWLNDFR